LTEALGMKFYSDIDSDEKISFIRLKKIIYSDLRNNQIAEQVHRQRIL